MNIAYRTTASDLAAALSPGQRFKLDYERSCQLHDEAIAEGTVWVRLGPCSIYPDAPRDWTPQFELIWSDEWSSIHRTFDEAEAVRQAHPPKKHRTEVNRLARRMLEEAEMPLPLLEPDETLADAIGVRRISLKWATRSRSRSPRAVMQMRAEILALRLRRRAA